MIVQLDLRMIESSERAIDQRQLSLVFEDSIHVDLGSMATNPQRFANAPGVTQNMYIVLPAAQFFALARANAVGGTIGSTSFAFTRINSATVARCSSPLCAASRLTANDGDANEVIAW